jgi:hypothetical protein
MGTQMKFAGYVFIGIGLVSFFFVLLLPLFQFQLGAVAVGLTSLGSLLLYMHQNQVQPAPVNEPSQ